MSTPHFHHFPARTRGSLSATSLLLLTLLTAACAAQGADLRRQPDGGTPHRGRSPARGGAERVESLEIQVGPLRFQARAAGPEDGEVVILLHGFPETSYAWRHVLPALAGAGYRAVAPDQRGYSPGARPAQPEDYAAPLLVGDLLGIADALGAERFHLVGHDWGALVAWVTAVRAEPRVQSLTAVSTAHPTALNAQRQDPDSCQSQASAIWAERKAPDAAAQLLANDAAGLRAEYGTLPEHAIETYLDVLGHPPALRAALNWYVANIDRPDPPPPLGPVAVPTLYVWGDQDPANCREPEAAHARLVTGPYQFEVLPGVDHWVPERAPKRFSRLLLSHLRRHAMAAAVPSSAAGSSVAALPADSSGAGCSGTAAAASGTSGAPTTPRPGSYARPTEVICSPTGGSS